MTISDRDASDALEESAAPVTSRLPGDLDMWVLVLGDLFFFGCYFIVYMVFRDRSPDQFAQAQRHLNLGVGVANTVVLLTSSMFVAIAVQEVRRGAVRTAERLIGAAGVCGVLFVALKAFEWHQEITHGFTVSNEFFSFYFVLTGIHLAHLVLGLLILGIVLRELRNPDLRRPQMVEQGATYWHMVDLLWVVIFAILYLMR
ncbi:cytochrome c oxidase subunit 3 [Nocardia jiangxiensis]|uniref:Cytochrome aa3 subunit 3 n=1 Tax=Nocardia jiangxiensis TaxID=282685 RepID=A0ABW6RY08_9NOCA|nr:cytochrome c oxidase subunit 3 [Nocardia jiangxiensis]